MEWAWKNLAESLAVPATLGMKLLFHQKNRGKTDHPSQSQPSIFELFFWLFTFTEINMDKWHLSLSRMTTIYPVLETRKAGTKRYFLFG
jgi:hypothetical protein